MEKKLGLGQSAKGKLDDYCDALLEYFPQLIADREGKFLRVPLQIRMVAEVLPSKLKASYDNEGLGAWRENVCTFFEELSLARLYEAFIKEKFYGILFGEKQPSMNLDDPSVKGMLDNEYKRFIKSHKRLAVRAIFQKDNQKILLGERDIEKVNKLIKKIKEGGEKAGIIEKVMDDMPVFAHRSYAEYFVVELICDKLNNSPSELTMNFLLNTILKGKNYQLMRKFFNSKLVGDQELIRLSSKGDYKEMIGELLMKQEGQITLHIAAKEGLVEVVKLLLDSVKDDRNKLTEVVNAKDKDHYTPLHLAADNGHKETVALLLKHGANIDLEAINVWKPLHLAADNGHEEIVKLLLDSVKDDRNKLTAVVNAKDKDHYTPLHLAADNGHVGIIKLLLDNAKKNNKLTEVINAVDEYNYTSLHLAARDG